ncbi:MAG: hypothetical protein ACRD1Y_03795 [Terriglobales bacterium]
MAGLEFYDPSLNRFSPALVARFEIYEADLRSLAAGCRCALGAEEPQFAFTQVADPVLTLRLGVGSDHLPIASRFEATIDLRAALPPERATPYGHVETSVRIATDTVRAREFATAMCDEITTVLRDARLAPPGTRADNG